MENPVDCRLHRTHASVRAAVRVTEQAGVPAARRAWPAAALGLPSTLVAGLVLAAALLLAPAPAEAFRCGGKIVTEGDHTSKVRKYCGEPLGIQERVIYRSGVTRPRYRVEGPGGWRYEREVLRYDRSYEEVVVEEWTYNFGPRRFMQLVRFENGFVTEIKSVGYGYTP